MPTILVVDAEDDVRLVVRKMLEQDGYTVLDTGLPLKALDLVKVAASTLCSRTW
jgi:CheY-like chemotaxis protein